MGRYGEWNISMGRYGGRDISTRRYYKIVCSGIVEARAGEEIADILFLGCMYPMRVQSQRMLHMKDKMLSRTRTVLTYSFYNRC